MDNHLILGVDVGASGIKGAIVDVRTGELKTERLKIETPKPATPEAIAETFKNLVELHNWSGPAGCGFPAIIKKGVAHSAANIHPSCIGTDFESLLSDAIGHPVYCLNDADAAGLAELHFGCAKGENGVIILITVGSGLGSAIFTEGKLLPNTELGHFYLKGMDIVAEKHASSAIKKKEDLSWDVWGKRLKAYLRHVDRLFSPDIIILGGGISRKFHNYEDIIAMDHVKIQPALLLNNAGSIGAAYYAASIHNSK